jgi:hypothetical protein
MNFLDKIVDHCLDAVMPKVVSHLQNAQTRGVDGIVMTGTWDPTDGTATIAMCDTVFPYTELGDQRILLTKIPIVVDHPSQQVGPVGDEQVVLTRTRSGWIAHMHADLENGKGLGAPAGERFIAHQKVNGTDPLTGRIQTQTDLVVKLTNDGSTPGDGLAAHRVEGGGLHLASTAGGHSDVMDDTAQMMIRKSAGGHSDKLDDAGKAMTRATAGGHTDVMDDDAKTITRTSAGGIVDKIDDAAQTSTRSVNASTKTVMAAAGDEISHVAGQVGLGDRFASLPATDAAITNSHINSMVGIVGFFSGSVNGERLVDMSVFANAMIAAGVPNASAVIANLATLSPVLVPSGSSVTRIKS